MVGACGVHAGVHMQKYVDHIPLINIRHGNIGSSESFRTLILQRGELGGRFERALVAYQCEQECGNHNSMNMNGSTGLPPTRKFKFKVRLGD